MGRKQGQSKTRGSAAAFAITVAFELVEGAFPEFHRLVARERRTFGQARGGLFALRRADACGCRSATHVFLYEIYRDRAAFDLHLASDHFRQFDQRSRDLVLSKTVVAYTVAGKRQGRATDMSGDVSALDLFGTDEPVAARRLLTAGPLTAILEDGNLRTICFAGIEAVRAINYLARDASWGTYKAVQSNLEVIESCQRFHGHLRRAVFRAERPLRLPDDHHRRSVGRAHHGGGRRGDRPTSPPIAPASSCCIRRRRLADD